MRVRSLCPGTAEISATWSGLCNELIHRVCTLHPANFIGVGQLPQSPGVRPDNCIPELERCVREFGFVGCNLNPDPTGGFWTDLPITDRAWYPLYERVSVVEGVVAAPAALPWKTYAVSLPGAPTTNTRIVTISPTGLAQMVMYFDTGDQVSSNSPPEFSTR